MSGTLEYFAIPDINQPDTITLWRQPEGCYATPWPSRHAHGPRLLKTDVPAALKGEDKKLWVIDWYKAHYMPWVDQMRAALKADPITAAARYAATQGRCCCCNRKLTDRESRRVGVGPDCRADWPAGAVELVAAAIAALNISENRP